MRTTKIISKKSFGSVVITTHYVYEDDKKIGKIIESSDEEGPWFESFNLKGKSLNPRESNQDFNRAIGMI